MSRRGAKLAACLAMVIIAAAAFGQEPKDVISVSGSRPVDEAIRELQRRYGWMVTYEEYPLQFSGDLEDVTTKVRKDLRPGEIPDASKRVLISKERSLTLTYELPEEVKSLLPSKLVVRQLLEQNASSGSSPVFELREGNDRLHVIATQVRNASGELGPIHPILDTIVSIPPEERTGTQLIRALLDAVNRSSGPHLAFGIAPDNILAQYHTSAGYEDLPARQVLEDFLAGMPRGDRCAWDLLCQGGSCALNMHVVLELNHQPFQGFLPPPPDRPERSHTIKKMPTVGPVPPAPVPPQ